MQTQNNQTNHQTEDTGDCLSAKELVDRHLRNKDHQISDDELKKVALDCTDGDNNTPNAEVTHDETSAALNTYSENENDNEDKEEDKKEKDVIITPLDVLG